VVEPRAVLRGGQRLVVRAEPDPVPDPPGERAADRTPDGQEQDRDRPADPASEQPGGHPGDESEPDAEQQEPAVSGHELLRRGVDRDQPALDLDDRDLRGDRGPQQSIGDTECGRGQRDQEEPAYHDAG